MRRALIALALAAAGALSGAAVAQEGKRCAPDPRGFTIALASDPCPSADAATAELALPLPDRRFSLVFREVRVPSAAYWCSAATRTFGDPARAGDDAFSADRTGVGVFGAFENAAEASESFFLGKYELSAGQAAAMLAIDPLSGKAGPFLDGYDELIRRLKTGAETADILRPYVADLERRRGEVSGEKMPNEALSMLSRPMRGLTPVEYAELLQRYNDWCFRDGECRRRLEARASAGGRPGFLRLPTEVEWEFAARGGGGVTEAEFASYLAPAGFESRFAEFAIVKESTGGVNDVRAIGYGRVPTRGGFYDLLGNAQELTLDPFRTLMVDGRVGGSAARGGSFLFGRAQTSFAARAELNPYRFRTEADGAERYLGANRDPATGVRVAIGAPAKYSEALLRELPARYRAECASSEIAAVESVAGCDGPGPVAPAIAAVCSQLRTVSAQARARADQLCRAATQSALMTAFEMVLRARRAAVYDGLMRDPATLDDDRERHRREFERYRGELRASTAIYLEFLGAARSGERGCGRRGLRTFRTERGAIIAQSPQQWNATLEQVGLDMEASETAPLRLAPDRVVSAFLMMGQRVQRAVEETLR